MRTRLIQGLCSTTLLPAVTTVALSFFAASAGWQAWQRTIRIDAQGCSFDDKLRIDCDGCGRLSAADWTNENDIRCLRCGFIHKSVPPQDGDDMRDAKFVNQLDDTSGRGCPVPFMAQ